MALTVNMPQLGESVNEGTLARWLKQPGEAVARYESIAEVASDKVNAEIPSPIDGTFGEVIAAEGSVISVGQPICTIEQGAAAGGESAAAPSFGDVQAATPPSASPEGPSPGPEPGGVASPGGAGPATGWTSPAAAEMAGTPRPAASAAAGAPAAPPRPQPLSAPVPSNGSESSRYHLTPAVRMLIREHEVDLEQIRGTGIGGRITKRDVLEHVQRREAGGGEPAGGQPAGAAGVTLAPRAGAPAASSAPAAAVGAPAPGYAAADLAEGDRVLPMTSVRRAIADHMVRSRHTSPHAWLAVEVDMSRVARVREAHRAEFRERYGVSLTYLPFVARATVEALRRRPTLNAQWSEEGLVLRRDIHLGIAVALEENLVVAVLRDADRYSVAGLAQATADLGARARANRLKLDEIQGGTFTLNNTGALGTVLTQAIINQPQAGILTMDAVVKRPVVVDDMIAIRPIMNLGLSFDHRLNDGLQAARFLQDVKGQLEGLDEHAAIL